MLSVNPLYYVTFTTATLCASFILFQGFNTTDAVKIISLLCGFLIIFSGVYLLNLSREDPNGHKLLANHADEGIPTDPLAGLQTRRSMQFRRSSDARRMSNGSAGYANRGDRDRLIHNYDVESSNFGLHDLTEDTDDDEEDANHKRTSFEGLPNQARRSINNSHEPRRPSRVVDKPGILR